MRVIDRAALLEWLSAQSESFYRRGEQYNNHWYATDDVIKQLESGAFDIPTDAKRCHLCPDDAETCYCYDDKPNADADVKEIEEALDEGRLTELTTEKLYQGVRQLLAKLADAQHKAQINAKAHEIAADGLIMAEAKINQAVEALEEIHGDVYADGYKVSAKAWKALQSIKGDSNAT